VRCNIFCLEVEIGSPDMWGMWAIEVEIEVQRCDQPWLERGRATIVLNSGL
jgi:hypothetical protein